MCKLLWAAVYAQDLTSVQQLLLHDEHVAEINTPVGVWQKTPVHVAVEKQNAKILKSLLFLKADANARMVNGTTPLHLAVELKRKDLVQDLLLVGADPRLRNYTGKNAVQMASDLGMRELAAVLQRAAAGNTNYQRALKGVELVNKSASGRSLSVAPAPSS